MLIVCPVAMMHFLCNYGITLVSLLTNLLLLNNNDQFPGKDSYYRKEDDPGHVLHPGTNCIDWEVLQVFLENC